MSERVHAFVGFVADFPALESGGDPNGKELADFVYAKYSKVGLVLSPPSDNGWAWDLHTRVDELDIYTIVGEVGDMNSNPPRQWLVTNDCRIPIFRRLFGRVAFEKKREFALRKLCECLHAAMTNDSRFSHINWYDAATFDKPGDVPSNKP
ncbi:MAG TPA: hypothetical protein VKX17_24595 [Planctomycetota bacterium]|nr:hypothetical protein [Planctomycetota bacterium]